MIPPLRNIRQPFFRIVFHIIIIVRAIHENKIHFAVKRRFVERGGILFQKPDARTQFRRHERAFALLNGNGRIFGIGGKFCVQRFIGQVERINFAVGRQVQGQLRDGNSLESAEFKNAL